MTQQLRQFHFHYTDTGRQLDRNPDILMGTSHHTVQGTAIRAKRRTSRHVSIPITTQPVRLARFARSHHIVAYTKRRTVAVAVARARKTPSQFKAGGGAGPQPQTQTQPPPPTT
jgi:hypothetical protein